MQQLVSIIAPAYKHASYIKQCIESIAAQTYQNKELIIIDDCSPDNTAEIIQNVISQPGMQDCFPGGISFIQHTTNQGAHNGINEGLSQAKGQYLTVINTDDLYQSNRLEVMINGLQEQRACFAFSKVDTVDDKGKTLRNAEWEYYTAIQNKTNMYPNINLPLITDNVAISTGNMLFTRKLYEAVGLFREYQYIHDWDFILRATLLEEPVYIEDTSYLYRLHPTNTFKTLQQSETLCYEECLKVLTNYSKRIQQKKYRNPRIPSVEVWEYFIDEVVRNRDIAHIWNQAKASRLTTY